MDGMPAGAHVRVTTGQIFLGYVGQAAIQLELSAILRCKVNTLLCGRAPFVDSAW